MIRPKLSGPSPLALACAATALLAAGCSRGGQTAATTAAPLDALPLTTDATAAAAAPAPAASALPSAAPVRIARLTHPQEGYAYLDRAYAASDGYADAPPDYAVDYNGERPWIWRGGDQSERVVERTPGGLRYYYYEPGASEPYLIQDPDYGYAYSDGQLVAIYGQNGQIEPYGFEQRRAGQAGRYLAWAAGLYAASLHQQRVAVERDRWREQQAYIAGQRTAWAQQQARYPAWNDYHQAHVQEETAHWAPERDRRQAELVRYGAASGQSYQGLADRGGAPQDRPAQGGGAQPRNSGPFKQAYGQPEVYSTAPLSGYDPNAARGAPAQAQADRRAGFDQRTADVQAERQRADSAHAAQVQAMQVERDQAHAAAETQRQATLQQRRDSEQAQRQAAEQAHVAQAQAAHEQQVQARAAEGQRQAALQQARAQAEAQQQQARQAHAAQASEARAQAEAQHQAAEQQARVAQAAHHPAPAHPVAPAPHAPDAPHGDHEHHTPGEPR